MDNLKTLTTKELEELIDEAQKNIKAQDLAFDQLAEGLEVGNNYCD
jgi:hypothetical protein